MATITVVYKGLTGQVLDVSVADTITIDQLITAIAADEGLPTDYYKISLENNPAVNDIVYGDSTTTIGSIGFVNGSRVICTTRQLGTKQDRQIQKLEIASVKRALSSRRSVYNVNELPNPYNGNDVDPDDGASAPLTVGRPWS